MLNHSLLFVSLNTYFLNHRLPILFIISKHLNRFTLRPMLCSVLFLCYPLSSFVPLSPCSFPLHDSTFFPLLFFFAFFVVPLASPPSLCRMRSSSLSLFVYIRLSVFLLLPAKSSSIPYLVSSSFNLPLLFTHPFIPFFTLHLHCRSLFSPFFFSFLSFLFLFPLSVCRA